MVKKYKEVIVMRTKAYTMFALLLAVLICVGCGGNSPGDDTQQAAGSKHETETGMQIETESEPAVGSEFESESESEIEKVSEVKTFTITATGDCALGALATHGYERSFHQFYDKYGEGYFFEKFKEVFEQDDLTLVNLECVLTDSTAKVEKTFNIKGKPEYTGIMTSNSVEAVSLGNNHTSDYGPESLEDTKMALDAAGIAYAFNDIISYYTTEEGIVAAIISSSTTKSGNTNERYLLNGVKEAREQGADIVIACCHWGIERDYYPNEYQQNLGHKLIDAGADLVIGNHPHVLQGIEEYKGKIICYSLGNFSFGANRNPEEKNTAVYQQTFTFVDGVLQADIDARIIPSRISGYDDYNNYQPIIATGEQANSIIKKMNQYSAPYSSVSFDEMGILILTESTEYMITEE